MAINPSDSTLQIVLSSNDSKHICQLFCLARSITQLGHHVSFVSTLSGIKAITIDPSNPNPSNLDLVPLREDDATDLEAEFDKFLLQATRDFDWVLFDISTFWVPKISKKFGIQSAYIASPSAVADTFLWPDAPKINQLMPRDFGSGVTYHPEEALKVVDYLLSREEQELSLYYRINKAITTCDVVALPIYYELDETLQKHLEQSCRKKVFSFGHMPQTATNAVDNYLMNATIIREWLDEKGQCSVVYVAFEIEIPITPLQVYQIAYELERSRIPFVWVLGNLQGGQTLNLPEGFVERTINYGLVCNHWVPHANILSHPSIGGFLTNGDWSLCIEALDCGIPVILAPFSNAEANNARSIEEKSFGCEVRRYPFHGHFQSVGVDHVLKHVMVEQGGGAIRARAKAMKGIFRCLQHRYLMHFMSLLEEMKKKKKNVVGTIRNLYYLCGFDGCILCKGKMKSIVGTRN